MSSNMLSELDECLKELPKLLQDRDKWESLLIDLYPPVIHRLFLKLSDDRTIVLHKIFPCDPGEKSLMHSHSWPFVVKIIEGGYEMGVGFSKDRKDPPPAIYTTRVKPDDIYEMTSSDVWHYTKALNNHPSYSVMLIGKRWRERLAQNNDPLSIDQRNELFDYFDAKFN